MTDALRVTVLVYATSLTAVLAVAAVTGRERAPTVTSALGVLQAGVVLQAIIDLVAVARGRHGDELGVHLAYLVTSLIIIPAVAASVRLDPRRWGSASLAVGCGVLALVSLRLAQTLARS